MTQTHTESNTPGDQESPVSLVVIAGPNGSGKTTLTDWLRHQGRLQIPANYVNPDEIAKTLPGSEDERNRTAQRLADDQRRAWMRAREPFAFETVGSHSSKLGIMQDARQLGYDVTLIFVCLATPDLNVRRVQNRVQDGGHDVPQDKVRERYHRVLSLLPLATELAHQTLVFDNSIALQGHRFQLALQGPEVIERNDQLEAWVENALLVPLQERGEDRARFTGLHPGYDTPATARLSAGDYAGGLLLLGHHLAFQDAGRQVVIEHDLAVVKPHQLVAGDPTMRLTYTNGNVTAKIASGGSLKKSR
ncbi:AAA family ATPase [Chromobacterium piscinae]|uniref:AAA family ATPase n=1 Tax=Chromobacterium piscinae TaxID=686831 RepID=UPI001E54E754|nr:AAA family ATPase [Chromobacterium piscinae]MCD5327906.1 zeta toxin family protein [Chromobacterium piscinae]